MGIFDKLKNKKINSWNEAYIGNPRFYYGKDGIPFGAFALTEQTLTSFPKDPKSIYKIDNDEVDEWKLILVSTTKDCILGEINYYEAIKKLMEFVIEEDDKNILIRQLSLDDLSHLL